MEITTVLNDKMREIAKRREFTSFWEAFDYFKLASYDELTALQIASELFDGDVWKNVINVSKRIKGFSEGGAFNWLGDFSFCSGSTYTVNLASSGSTTVMGIDPAIDDNGAVAYTYNHEPDDLDVEIFVINSKGNKAYMPVYKAYTETRKYKEIPELDSQIKIIRTTLSTELAIKLFNDGYEKF